MTLMTNTQYGICKTSKICMEYIWDMYKINTYTYGHIDIHCPILFEGEAHTQKYKYGIGGICLKHPCQFFSPWKGYMCICWKNSVANG